MALGQNNYGKSDVRVVKVVRGPDRHEIRDLTVDVALEGDFEAAHVEGDNTGLLATDTMRNTVYAIAKQDPIEHLETFARRLVAHFVEAGPTVSRARVRAVEHPWARIDAHPHAFQRGHGGDRVAVVSGDGSTFEIDAGIEDLLVLKTTGSGWSGFLREEYTSLKETDDRILATIVTATWRYSDPVDYTATWLAVRDTILETLGDHYSPSVQFTLNRMGEAVLERHPEIERIHFSLPNKHHLLFDLERFGLENDGEVFHATTEPYGLIEGTVERTPARVAAAPEQLRA
jgi:urate oxidase